MEKIPAEQPPTVEVFDRYLRKYNDTTTWLAETLDGSMRTPFEFTSDGQDLYAEDGSPVSEIFQTAIDDAKRIAAVQPELSFEPRRRRHEDNERVDMLGMVRGERPNTMIVVSDYPPELMRSSKSVGGYNGMRKQTMLRVLVWDGSRIKMFSQSLDASNRPALEAIYREFGRVPEAGELLGQRIHTNLAAEDQAYLTDRLTGVYDRTMARQFGGQWYAGRREIQHDTYQFVLSQHQLVDRFVMAELNGGITKTERYNIAALLTKRFEQFKDSAIHFTEQQVVVSSMTQNLDWLLQLAGDEARAEGRTFNGCGTSASDDSSGARDRLRAAGYGNQSDEDDKGSLEFTCPRGHYNRRPYGKLIDVCMTCRVSVKC